MGSSSSSAGAVDGRRLPLDPEQAQALVADVAPGVGEIRGQAAWATEPLVAAVLAASRLWQAHGAWLAAADVNPLVVTADGVVAVDALFVAD